jgi:hypothetical protein
MQEIRPSSDQLRPTRKSGVGRESQSQELLVLRLLEILQSVYVNL